MDIQMDGHIKAQHQNALTYLAVDSFYQQLQVLSVNADGRNFLGESLSVGFELFADALWTKMSSAERVSALYQKDNHEQHCFHLVAARGYEDLLCKFLNEKNASVKDWLSRDNKGDTPLMVAAKHGHRHIVLSMINRLKKNTYKKYINALNNKQDALLHIILRQPTLSNDVDLLSYLIERGGDLALANKKRETPFTYISQWSLALQFSLLERLSEKSINTFLLNYYGFVKKNQHDPVLVANYLALTKKYHEKANFLGEMDLDSYRASTPNLFDQNGRTFFKLDTLEWSVIKSWKTDDQRLNRWKEIGGPVASQPVTQFLYGEELPLENRSNPLLPLNDLIAMVKDFQRELAVRDHERNSSYNKRCAKISGGALLLLGISLFGVIAFVSGKLAYYDKLMDKVCPHGKDYNKEACKFADKKDHHYLLSTVFSSLFLIPSGIALILLASSALQNKWQFHPGAMKVENDAWQELLSKLSSVVLSPLQDLKTNLNITGNSLPTDQALIARLEAVPASLNVAALPITQLFSLLKLLGKDLKQLRKDSIYADNTAFLFTEPSDVTIAMPVASSSMSLN